MYSKSLSDLSMFELSGILIIKISKLVVKNTVFWLDEQIG